MIDTYLVDEIKIISYAKDVWGKSTRTASAAIAARVEDVQKWVKNQNGMELLASTLVILGANESVIWDNKIQIIKRRGASVADSAKEYPIKGLERPAGFTGSHLEVYL